MEEESILARVGMYIHQRCLVVPIQVELQNSLMRRVQGEILNKVFETGTKGVIIDISEVQVIDTTLGQAIIDTVRMVSLLGAKGIVTGMGPGVAASLIDLDFDPGDVQTAINLEERFRLLEPFVWPEREQDEDEENEAEIEDGEGEAGKLTSEIEHEEEAVGSIPGMGWQVEDRAAEAEEPEREVGGSGG